MSSNQFTPFRRAVCDVLVGGESGKSECSYWLGPGSEGGRGQGLCSIPVEGGGALKTSQSGRQAGRQVATGCGGQSGGLVGSVVPGRGAGSLGGEVLCLAEVATHTRHIEAQAHVDAETLQERGRGEREGRYWSRVRGGGGGLPPTAPPTVKVSKCNLQRRNIQTAKK